MLEDGTLKLKIRAQPKDGEANERIINILSQSLKLPSSRIAIVKGAKSKDKLIEIDGVQDVRDLLLTAQWK